MVPLSDEGLWQVHRDVSDKKLGSWFSARAGYGTLTRPVCGTGKEAAVKEDSP